MKQLLLLAIIFATATATSSNLPQEQSKSGVTQEFRTAVKALLDVTDYEGTMRENITSAYKQLGQEENPYVADFVNQLLEQMPDKMVDIYSKYFTVDEIKQLTEVNKNEIIIKLRKLQPQMSQELMQEGQSLAKGEKSPTADIVVEKDFDEAMREYFEVSRFDEQMKQIFSVIENYYGFKTDLLNGFTNQMPDIMVRIYSKYFTTNEIKQAIALEKTPCLKKFIEKTPAITQDTLEETGKITKDIMEKLLADIYKEHSNDNSETPAERPKGWFLEKIRSLNQ
jgi:hypothetical protein